MTAENPASVQRTLCRRCGCPLDKHSVFLEEPTAEQLVGLVGADFGVAMSGIYCPENPMSAENPVSVGTEQGLLSRLYDLQREGGSYIVDVSPFDAFVLCGVLQLALRHPGCRGGVAEAAKRFVDLLADELDRDVPGLRELVARGYDPSEDR